MRKACFSKSTSISMSNMTAELLIQSVVYRANPYIEFFCSFSQRENEYCNLGHAYNSFLANYKENFNA